eukprot:14078386-Alexandrium_andersonii.AAC.1
MAFVGMPHECPVCHQWTALRRFERARARVRWASCVSGDGPGWSPPARQCLGGFSSAVDRLPKACTVHG